LRLLNARAARTLMMEGIAGQASARASMLRSTRIDRERFRAPALAGKAITGMGAATAFALGAASAGAIAIGALAIGRIAIGRLAMGRLAMGSGRVRRLEIDELVVRRLRVVDGIDIPEVPEGADAQRQGARMDGWP
jgi:hypothetical protein